MPIANLLHSRTLRRPRRRLRSSRPTVRTATARWTRLPQTLRTPPSPTSRSHRAPRRDEHKRLIPDLHTHGRHFDPLSTSFIHPFLPGTHPPSSSLRPWIANSMGSFSPMHYVLRKMHLQETGQKSNSHIIQEIRRKKLHSTCSGMPVGCRVNSTPALILFLWGL